MSGYNSKKQMAKSRWVIELIEDGEDVILPLNDEIIAVSYTHLTLPTIYSV